MARFLLYATLLFGVSFAAHAFFVADFLYDCEMSDLDNGGGWVSPKIVIVIVIVMQGDGTVRVIDPMTAAPRAFDTGLRSTGSCRKRTE